MSVVARETLHAAVNGLTVTTPWRGLCLTGLASLGSLALLAAIFFAAEHTAVFLTLCVAKGIWYTFAMTLTHDAIHNTLTGWRRFDAIAARAFSWFIFWPHATYAELHKMHHRMNGRDRRDPENPTPTAQQYEWARGLRRLYYRYQWPLNLFVFGGIGMVVRHAYLAWKLRFLNPRLRHTLWQDACGIAACLAITLVLTLSFEVLTVYLVCYLIVERIVGFHHQLRSHVEHFGLWEDQRAQIDARLLSCRNLPGSAYSRWIFNGLNFHSVHHAFPAIPFYNLKRAHRRIAAAYANAGEPLPTTTSYVAAYRALASPSHTLAPGDRQSKLSLEGRCRPESSL